MPLIKRITNSEGASVSAHDHVTIYGNSYGFVGSYASTSHSISCGLIAYDGHEMQRDFDYTNARDPQDLEDVATLARRAVERTLSRLGNKRLSTRTCPVIFAPEIARGLLGHLMSAISGGNLYRNSSFLLNQLGQKIFPEHIRSIDERPHLLKAIGSAPFDDEGVITRAKDLVHEGILTNYLLSSYSARKLGMKTTGNAGGIHNVFISHGDQNLGRLITADRYGIISNRTNEQGVNIVR